MPSRWRLWARGSELPGLVHHSDRGVHTHMSSISSSDSEAHWIRVTPEAYLHVLPGAACTDRW
jgi:hypothetical protein